MLISNKIIFLTIQIKDLLPNGNQEISSQFFQKIFDLVIDFIGKTMSRSEKVIFSNSQSFYFIL